MIMNKAHKFSRRGSRIARRGMLLPLAVFLLLGTAAILPLLVEIGDTSRRRGQFSEEWTRIQWAMEGASRKQMESSAGIDDPFSGVVSTLATFTYPEGNGRFDIAVTLSEGRTMMGRQRVLSATAKAYRNGQNAGYYLDDLEAATVSVPGVAAGEAHSMAWRKDGRLLAWGKNGDGQLGLNSTSGATVPSPTLSGDCPTTAPPSYVQGWMVVCGASHTLALDYFGGAYSWGRNDQAQLAHSGTSAVWFPRTVIANGVHLQNVSDLAAGGNFSLALHGSGSGTVLAWGNDQKGQLGYDPEIRFLGPQPPAALGTPKVVVGLSGRGSSLSNIVGIAAGSQHALAMDKAGNIYAWGDNSYGQLGIGTNDSYKRKPYKVNNSESLLIDEVPYAGTGKNPKATQFFLPAPHFLATLTVEMPTDKPADTWIEENVIVLQEPGSPVTERLVYPTRSTATGTNRFEWTFDEQDTTDKILLEKPGIYTVKVMQRYKSSFLGIPIGRWKTKDLNSSWYKSASSTVELKDRGVFAIHAAPAEEPTDFYGVAAGGDFSMAIRRRGNATELHTWGRNNYQQTGHGSDSPSVIKSMSPIQNFPPAGQKIRMIAAGREHAMALTESGKLYTWGRNNFGQLGLNDTTSRSTPQLVTYNIGGVSITGIAAGAYHSLAVDAEGRVYSWGNNADGRLGRSSSTTTRTRPEPVPGFP